MSKAPYRGRFAPSPTGLLHFGSLIAALGSYLQAKSRDGEWLVRIEDLDPPREQPGAADQILRLLEAYGMHWDGEVLYQSTRSEAYLEALDELASTGQMYSCGCSRTDLAATGIRHSNGTLIYPGTCRKGMPPGRRAKAQRVLTQEVQIRFTDAVQGPLEQDVEHDVGDFVVRRADGLFAYQLAVVVDDAHQGITEIVRGCDLLDSTPRQIHLQRLLGLPTPDYMHLPLAMNGRGDKLSKQTRAPHLKPDRAVTTVWRGLIFLGQQPPAELRDGTMDDLWNWAIAHWDASRIPAREGIQAGESGRSAHTKN